jgi:hypothetical protein
MTSKPAKRRARKPPRLGRTKRARIGFVALKDASLNRVVVTSFE